MTTEYRPIGPNRYGLELVTRAVTKGGNYGLNDCLTHNDTDPLVEFYSRDTFGPGKHQFISRYYLSTLTERGAASPYLTGLNLDGGVERWDASGYQVDIAIRHAQQQAEAA